MRKVVVLGGYGNFGKRIVENLADIDGITVMIAGRSSDKALSLIEKLKPGAAADLKPLVIDIFSQHFKDQLAKISPYLVIHTSGPFQAQDHRVPKACLDCGAHYIDLADDRRFVCDISELNAQAKERELLVVSGASSVPGLSSAVVDHYEKQFNLINSIELSIAPGNKAERGLATIEGILSYTGHAIKVFKDGRWQGAYGWMDSKVNDFGLFVGKRHLANVDVPDLELFPHRYRVSKQVSFQAGLEIPLLHLTMVGMAYLAKIGLVTNWAPLSKIIMSTSNLFISLGSDEGAMQVSINGVDNNQGAKQIKWTLYAPQGNGPHIPTLSTIILARKLLCEEKLDPAQFTGAKPCLGLLKLTEFNSYFDALNIFFEDKTC
ncbi:saccharopine dehydrogenase family protein [Shewanella woodyi]|uniref:Saccharopine dehydrogenase n=1 Tax=Shewanella woodyi (strain ATCC 51908 / MS32) TaxID=392500 RepID=B1KF81_SHEWM|nr:saccharopine dehydrogenase NADP-binding domain-containing protein [Shewanella woodyi]ACA86622.1 Saccharopine dehydrogenase [Shewanella woodyi ATCC 51908]